MGRKGWGDPEGGADSCSVGNKGEEAGKGTVWSGICASFSLAGEQTAWLTHGALQGQGHPLACLCHTGKGQRVPGRNYQSEVQKQLIPGLCELIIQGSPIAGLQGAKTHLIIRLQDASGCRADCYVGMGPSL